MSKRHSIGSSPVANTLFKYFLKSPASASKSGTPSTSTDAGKSGVGNGGGDTNDNNAQAKLLPPKTPTTGGSKTTKQSSNKKTPVIKKFAKEYAGKRSIDEIQDKNPESDDEDKIINENRNKKRRRIILDDDSDSDNENDNGNRQNQSKQNKKVSTKKSKDNDKDYNVDDEDDDDDDDDVDDDVEQPSLPVPTKKQKLNKTTTIDGGNFEDKLKALEKGEEADGDVDNNIDINLEEENDDTLIDEPQIWLHNKLEFLKPNKIKDVNGHRPDHPEYDSTTLHVPQSYLESLTPGMRQWWDLKSYHFDSILFFKVGKFYEMYHMDADVAVAQLGFTYMRGEFAHSGFPEQSYDRMATSLVARGFKVARVEQTETPDMMTERVRLQKKTTKFDKVVKREVCQVTNRGTQVFGQQVPITNDHQPNYMLALVEEHSKNSNRFGVCFLDTSLAKFHLGEFDDDKHCSRLLTLLSHNPPVLVITERGGQSIRTAQIFKTVLCNALKEQLLPESQFWSAEKTLKILSEKYFTQINNDEEIFNWPLTLKSMQDNTDSLGLTPASDSRLALRAMGASIWYLTKCLVDEQIMAMAKFSSYHPPDNLLINNENVDSITNSVATKMSKINFNRHMVLDSISISNLKIIDDELSLLTTLDQCCTKFGKRLLHYWVCTPSCEPAVIRERQTAIGELMENSTLLQELRLCLGSIPDLERQLAQIHTFGNAQHSKTHPDGRAIFFEQKTYNKKKIQDFIATLNGFDALTKLPQIMTTCSSPLLIRLTQTSTGRNGKPTGQFPDMIKTLQFFKNGFDHEEALKSGVIAPGAGVDQEYDSIEKTIEEIKEELNKYLKKQEKHFGCRLQYFGNDKKRFQLEIPESNAKRADSSYSFEGQKKGKIPVKRFHTEETRDFLKQMLTAEDKRNHVLKDLSRRMLEKFSNKYEMWKQCVDLIGQLDVLTSLAIYGNQQNQFCFPEIVDGSDGPILEIEDGFHPCMNLKENFIANGITLGGGNGKNAALALLTGPNMGGKSTLMRQVGLLVVMSQIGSPIPATNCRLSIFDRIFTRLGAQDDIMAGHSTFLVELNETAAILKHSTINSLVLLDELGRGTATYDGTAIAAAVVHYLADLKCRCLFSTHYHNLVDNFHDDSRVSLGHMACMVENEDNDDPTQETVTFLYKYSNGPCPKSYGFNAAKLAGMPNNIIKRAHELSKKVESIALKRKLFSKMLATTTTTAAATKTTLDPMEIRDLLGKMRSCIINKIDKK